MEYITMSRKNKLWTVFQLWEQRTKVRHEGFRSLSVSLVFCLCLPLPLSLFFLPFLLAVSFSRWSFWSSRSNCPKREPGRGNNDRRPGLSCTFWRLNKAIVRFLETLLLLLLRATLRRPSKEHSLLRPTSSVRFTGCFCIFQIFFTLYNFSFNKLINIFLHNFNRYRFSSCFLLQVKLDYFK